MSGEPPEPVPCGFEEVILERFSDGVTLRNHDKISRILSFLDVDSLLSISLASKKTFYAVKVHLNKELYHLPFNKDSICTNLIFCKFLVIIIINYNLILFNNNLF